MFLNNLCNYLCQCCESMSSCTNFDYSCMCQEAYTACTSVNTSEHIWPDSVTELPKNTIYVLIQLLSYPRTPQIANMSKAIRNYLFLKFPFTTIYTHFFLKIKCSPTMYIHILNSKLQAINTTDK
jgi:hypothetical protein